MIVLPYRIPYMDMISGNDTNMSIEKRSDCINKSDIYSDCSGMRAWSNE